MCVCVRVCVYVLVRVRRVLRQTYKHMKGCVRISKDNVDCLVQNAIPPHYSRARGYTRTNCSLLPIILLKFIEIVFFYFSENSVIKFSKIIFDFYRRQNKP